MRLQHPTTGTVVHVEGDLAERYLAAGWTDTSKPKRTSNPKRTRKAN